MKNLISGLIDGKLTGLIQRYALWHVAHCPRCHAALTALARMSERLRALGAAPSSTSAAAQTSTSAAPQTSTSAAVRPAALSSDRWTAMEAAWDEAERTA